MFSKDPKGKGKAKDNAESSGGSSKPTKVELQHAAATIAWALETIGVTKYGFIGGGAVSILASQYGLRIRETEDLDLIVQPATMSAELVSNNLTTNETLKGHFISKRDGYIDKRHVVVSRRNETIYVPVEIFDWHVCPNRRQYYDLDRNGNETQYVIIDNKQTHLLNPGWLLRQKILTYAQRQNRSGTDMDDLHSLCRILSYRNETITIVDENEVEALKAVLSAPNPPNLKGFVRCAAIWPTK